MLVEEVITKSRVVPTEAQYAIVDRVQKASALRSVRLSCVIAAVLIAGCAAHPGVRAFSFKILSLPFTSTEVLASSGETVQSVTSYSIVTNAPAPAYLPEGYIVTRASDMDSGLAVENLEDTATLLWRRASDGAEVVVSWVTGAEAAESFDEAWRSARSNPKIDRTRLDDRSRGLIRPVQVSSLDRAALEIRWKTLGGIVSIITTHESTSELMRMANSVQ